MTFEHEKEQLEICENIPYSLDEATLKRYASDWQSYLIDSESDQNNESEIVKVKMKDDSDEEKDDDMQILSIHPKPVKPGKEELH